MQAENIALKLTEASDALAYAGDRLAEAATALRDPGTPEQPPEQWLYGAKRELAELIREVEGPRPRRGGRK